MKNKILVLAVASLLAACGSGSGSSSDATDSTLNSQAKQFQRVSKTALTAASYQNTVQSLYIAYFGRPADPIGLANFEAALLADGAPADIPTLVNAYATNASLKTLIDSFGTSKESQTLYGTGNATTFVQAVFQNVLGRAPLTEGLNFWVTQINGGGVTQGQAALAIMSAALTNNTTQGLLDAQLIANRITAASYFTGQVAATDATSAYTGATAAGEARTMLAKVTATTDLTAFQAQEATAIAGLPNYPTIRGTTSAYTAANYVTLDSSGSTILDAAGNKYAIDSTSRTVVALGSGVALNGLTVDVQTNTDSYLISGGKIVGILGYANTASGVALVFIFTANTQTGVGQINVSPGSYSLGCNSNCTTNTSGATPTALQEIDTQVGTGAVATLGSTVTVNYTGWLYSATAANFEGAQFDSSYSRNQPFPFSLGAHSVIEGWDQGVIGMKVGGTRTLIIPSLLGYGAYANGSIPANSTLVFTVTLVSVQ